MNFLSTRGQTAPHTFSQAVATGLAPDGGLFIPETLPRFTAADLDAFSKLSYPALTHALLSRFATDIPADTLRAIVEKSYTRFDHPGIAPIVTLDENTRVLELFHGPTLAFKDFALQLLGNLYEYQCAQNGETLNILGATSGDTGSAAIHGLLGKPRINIFIAYPDGRTSPLQERQMACTGAPNVHALAIDGTFDDAQHALKELFADQTFRQKHHLSAVNSINIARILAQSAYYLHAYLRLPGDQRDNTEIVVPTGNFGNVLAGWLLRKMAVPLRNFRVATNQNDILHRLFTTGNYSVTAVHPSLAPSMDIQVSSNFERYLHYTLADNPAWTQQLLQKFNNNNSTSDVAQIAKSADGAAAQNISNLPSPISLLPSPAAATRLIMEKFKTTGTVDLTGMPHPEITASRCDDTEIPSIIKTVYQKYRYIADPHTACAFKDLAPGRPSLILATAHPAKFPETIKAALNIDCTHPTLEGLKTLPLNKHPLPATPAAIRDYIDQHAAK